MRVHALRLKGHYAIFGNIRTTLPPLPTKEAQVFRCRDGSHDGNDMWLGRWSIGPSKVNHWGSPTIEGGRCTPLQKPGVRARDFRRGTWRGYASAVEVSARSAPDTPTK